MNNSDNPNFFVILMPRERISEIQINEDLNEPILILKRSEIERMELKKKVLINQVKFFKLRYKNKWYKMSDIYRISGEGEEYLDYLKIEGTFVNFSNSIDLIYAFMKDFGIQFFEWRLLDYTNNGPLEFTTPKKYHEYLVEFWQRKEPEAISLDKSTSEFKHPEEALINYRVKPKYR